MFLKNNEPILLNLFPPNNIKEIENLINEYLTLNTDNKNNTKAPKKIIIKKLLFKGSFLLNPLFKRIKNDSSHKTEYINILERLNIINGCKTYNIDCYRNKWSIEKYKYTSNYVKLNLRNWLLYKNKRKVIEKKLKGLGKFATPYILKFLINHKYLNYKDTKKLYYLLNNMKEYPFFDKQLFDDKHLIKEFFKFYNTKNKYYYENFTFTNNIKTIFTNTQFSNWTISAFSFNFGVINNKVIYNIILPMFLRTLIIILFIITSSYYFSIIIILKVKIKSNKFYKFLDKFFQLLSFIPSLMLVILFTLITNFFELANRERLIQYITLLSIIAVLIIFRNIESIIIREKKKNEIISLNFFGINKNIIFKKYVYKNINIQLLKKIKLLIIPIISYTIVLDYLLEFNGLGNLFIKSLIKSNYNLLRIAILFIGIVILITRIYIDFIIFINLKEINKDEANS